jgi:hypothetical protein
MTKPIILGAVLCAALLGACGGDSHRTEAATPVAPAPPAPPATVVDAFTTSVKSASMASPDDTEPANIDAIVATAPEDAEPVAL